MQEFIAAIRAEGINPPELIKADGKLHRFAGNGSASKNSWYVFHLDEPAAGAFGDWREGTSFTWCAKTRDQLTEEEKRAFAQRMDADRKQREFEERKVNEECREKCAKLWASAGDVSATHPYIVKKGIHPVGIKQLRDMLLVPVLDHAGVLHGLQFITPDGAKRFKTGTAKSGRFCPIGAWTPESGIVSICEGYATGATIHEATGVPVLVAFDAGNLLAVARSARDVQPAVEIVITADNDAWFKERSGESTIYHETPCNVGGQLRENVGLVKAAATVRTIKDQIRITYPEFIDRTAHPTDFNDLHTLQGIDEVRRQFTGEHLAQYDQPSDENQAEEHFKPVIKVESVKFPFRFLGYDQHTFYFLPNGSLQVMQFRATELTELNLYQLAPYTWWFKTYGDGERVKWKHVANTLIQESYKNGIYDPVRLRGRGAWWDKDRVVMHLGDRLIVGDREHTLNGFDSHMIYEAGRSMEIDAIGATPMSTAQSSRLIDMAELASWQHNLYGRFLIGWCVVAPICGALNWRPHIWITGSSGVGKSWILAHIVKRTIGSCGLDVQGSTTEAGIRQKLRTDALPVLFDEAEAEDHGGMKRLQGVLELARQASSEGAEIMKGTTGGRAMSFHIRSAFCFSSIGVTIAQQADHSRITILSMVPGSPERFERLKRLKEELLGSDEQCRALRARTISLVPVIRENAKTFAAAAADRLKSQRLGDQVGVLLAGAYSLRSAGVITLEAAKEWIGKQDMEDSEIQDDQRDEYRCLRLIMEQKIRIQGYRVSHDIPVAELIQIAMGRENFSDGVSVTDVDRELRRNGIRVSVTDSMFMVACAHPVIMRWLDKSPWMNGYAALLERLPGAMKAPKVVRITTPYRVIIIPEALL